MKFEDFKKAIKSYYQEGNIAIDNKGKSIIDKFREKLD